MEPPDVILIAPDNLSLSEKIKFDNMIQLLIWAFDNTDVYLFNRATEYLKKLNS